MLIGTVRPLLFQNKSHAQGLHCSCPVFLKLFEPLFLEDFVKLKMFEHLRLFSQLLQVFLSRILRWPTDLGGSQVNRLM